VVIEVGEKQFQVHKLILSTRSPVFEAMFNSELSESKQNLVKISEVGIEVFEKLLRYIYTGSVESIEPNDTMELFELADRVSWCSLLECNLNSTVCSTKWNR